MNDELFVFYPSFSISDSVPRYKRTKLTYSSLGMLGEGAMETVEESAVSVHTEVVMSEEDVLRGAVKLRSEEAGVEGARNTQVFVREILWYL